ncbi:MAG: DUF2934 domain-containing protein [Candidatus Omnitrophota bacterium]|nr:DUF2934 domain-containing protein [Candidatus Omnitrophota bacterium]
MMDGHNYYKTGVAECIKKNAYESLENDGRRQGRDKDYWLDAEKAVMAQIREQYS